jgi:hypothetical protein
MQIPSDYFVGFISIRVHADKEEPGLEGGPGKLQIFPGEEFVLDHVAPEAQAAATSSKSPRRPLQDAELPWETIRFEASFLPEVARFIQFRHLEYVDKERMTVEG